MRLTPEEGPVRSAAARVTCRRWVRDRSGGHSSARRAPKKVVLSSAPKTEETRENEKENTIKTLLKRRIKKLNYKLQKNEKVDLS